MKSTPLIQRQPPTIPVVQFAHSAIMYLPRHFIHSASLRDLATV
ncbi:flagellar basal body protein [Burkholderia pseudomallei 305]|nr:flagellar basal body protein [Burkholderia pseudomallei 305]